MKISEAKTQVDKTLADLRSEVLNIKNKNRPLKLLKLAFLFCLSENVKQIQESQQVVSAVQIVNDAFTEMMDYFLKAFNPATRAQVIKPEPKLKKGKVYELERNAAKFQNAAGELREKMEKQEREKESEAFKRYTQDQGLALLKDKDALQGQAYGLFAAKRKDNISERSALEKLVEKGWCSRVEMVIHKIEQSLTI